MAGTSAPLRRLGAELRRLREAADRTQVGVGAEIGRTHTTLVNWESGNTKISGSDLARLLAALRVPAEVRKGLEQLRDEARRGSTQWAVYGLPDRLKPLVSFEEDATAVASFEPVLIPGLLQTEAYARAIHTTGRRKVAPEFVEKWVSARMQRQERLRGPDPLHVRVVISEAAARLTVGGPKVHIAQLEHLLELGCSDNVDVHLLPRTGDGYGGVGTNFLLLHFADAKADPPLGYFDGPMGGHMISDEGDVAMLINMFDDLHHMALPESRSTEKLTEILEEHKRKATSDE